MKLILKTRFWRLNLIKICEIVIWLQEVTLARWTQPSGPLCLWHCLINKYMSFQSRHFHFSYNGSGQIAFFFSVILINRILQHMLNTLIINQNFQRWPKSTSIAWFCIVLHGIAWNCMLLNYLAASCSILHHLNNVYTFISYLQMTA